MKSTKGSLWPVEEEATATREHDDDSARLRIPLGSTLTVVLGVLLVGVLVGLFFAVRHTWRSDVAPDGTTTSAAARSALMHRTARMTETVLSYSAASFDEDAQRAGSLMTPSMREQYLKTLDKVRKDVHQQGLTLEATTLASSVVSMTPDRATLLEFVDQTTTAKGSKHEQSDQNRLRVSLVHTDQGWRISKLDAF